MNGYFLERRKIPLTRRAENRIRPVSQNGRLPQNERKEQLINTMETYHYTDRMKEIKHTPAMRALQDAALALLMKKEPYAIDVAELCREAHVSRNTFYAYYDSVDEVISERIDRLIGDLQGLNENLASAEKEISQDYFQKTADYLLDHKEEFLILTEIRPNFLFINRWKACIAHHLAERKRSGGEKASDLELEIASSAAVSGLIYYLSHSDSVSMDKVHDLISKALRIF